MKWPWCVALSLSFVAAPAASEKAPPAIVGFTVKPVYCETDGGSVPCGEGHTYLGVLLRHSFHDELPRVCADAKRGRVGAYFSYEYNDGEISMTDADKLAPCVAAFLTELTARWRTAFRTLAPLDPGLDVRQSYTVTITIR